MLGACVGNEWRTDLKEINITQPQGPSFSIEGNLVKWQKWHIRIGFNAREGLLLHQVRAEALYELIAKAVLQDWWYATVLFGSDLTCCCLALAAV